MSIHLILPKLCNLYKFGVLYLRLVELFLIIVFFLALIIISIVFRFSTPREGHLDAFLVFFPSSLVDGTFWSLRNLYLNALNNFSLCIYCNEQSHFFFLKESSLVLSSTSFIFSLKVVAFEEMLILSSLIFYVCFTNFVCFESL